MVRILATAFALATALSQVAAAPVRAAPAVARTNHESSYDSGSSASSSSYYSSSSGSSNDHSWQGSQSSSSYEPAAQNNYEQKDEKSYDNNQASEYQSSNQYDSGSKSSWSSMPQYGSGKSNWGGQGYNDCVQKCMAQYSLPDSKMDSKDMVEAGDKASPTETAKPSGTVHTVIVAPTQGVLRFVPFAVNASVGDTVRFVWGAGPHTVTLSSALNPCNASQSPDAFASGRQNKSFVFDKVVNSTDPTFFYCSVPGHCQKGMFGVINPGSGASVDTKMTVGQYMQKRASEDSTMAAMWSYVSNKTKETSAYEWGMNMDMSNIPEGSYDAMVENTMYSQLFFAANPGALEAGQGASDQGNGIQIPADITVTMQQLASMTGPSGTSGSGSGVANGGVPASSEVPANSVSEPAGASEDPAYSTDKPATNAAGKLGASSTAVIAFITLAASFLVL